MATIATTTQTITSATPYTLAAGNTIFVSLTSDNNNSGEAIYTDFSPTNPTTIGGATIVIDGSVIDESSSNNTNEYGIQSRAVADATLLNFGLIDAPSLIAVGWNDGLIINELGGTIEGAGGILIGNGSFASTIINYGEIIGSDSAGLGFLNVGTPAFVTNASSGYIRGGLTGGAGAESGIYQLNGTITNAGTIAAGGAAGDAINFYGSTGDDALILDPGQVLKGMATAAGAGNMLVLGGTGLGTLSNPGSYLGFVMLSVATGADWLAGTVGSTISISGITKINDFGTLNIAGAIANTTIDMEGSISGAAAEVDFTGTYSATKLTDYGGNDRIVFSTLAGGAGYSFKDSYNTTTGILTVTEFNASGVSVGSGTASVSGIPGGASLTSASFDNINGPNGETVVLGASSLANGGPIDLDYGALATLNNTGVVDTVPVTFGSHQSALGVLNTLYIDGSDGGTPPYGGTITGFGLNDDIVIGPATIPSFASGDKVALSYAGSILSVAEINASGATIGSTTLNVGSGYATNSFVALLGADGINIETPATAEQQGFTFSATGTGDFENPSDYLGGLAPGSSIAAGETVVIEAGTATVSSPLADSGTILVTGSSADFVDLNSLGGGGALDLAAGGMATLSLSSSLSSYDMAGNNAHTTIDFTGSYLASADATVLGEIGNFGTTDSIILTGFTAIAGDELVTDYNPMNGEFSLTEYNQGASRQDESVLITVTGPGDLPLTGANFTESFGSNGVVITDMPCFAAGTRILTPAGQVKVEDLAEGDTVLTASDGGVQKIIWAGRRTVDLTRHAMPEKVIPVIVLAGAFGPGLPERDLKLSPDHALLIDGVLIEAKTLVNGSTVIRDAAARSVTYHHIELERHDVVLAEGIAAETYLDSGNRRNFEQDAAPLALHPDFAAASRVGACAPLAVDGPQVRAVREQLLSRAAALGFTATGAVDLTVKAGAARIAARSGRTAGELAFALPAGARAVTLVSSTGVPAEMSADPSDRRALGVAVTGLTLIVGGDSVELDLDDPSFSGFHAAEPGHRWTDGAARINLPAYAGEAVLIVGLRGQAARWAAPATAQGRIAG
jgi:hypothetical protein